MSKRYYQNTKNFYDQDDYEYDRYLSKELENKKKLKRMKNAMRSKNIDELMDWDED